MKFVLPTDPILREAMPLYEGNTHDLRMTSRSMLAIMRNNSEANYADSMRHDMSRPNGLKVECGVGLAAPQVGLRLRMFVMQLGLSAERVCINPEVVDMSADYWEKSEGCLTFPGKRVEVSRPGSIIARWTCLKGKRKQERLYDWGARVFLHELDHLDGKVIW